MVDTLKDQSVGLDLAGRVGFLCAEGLLSAACARRVMALEKLLCDLCSLIGLPNDAGAAKVLETVHRLRDWRARALTVLGKKPCIGCGFDFTGHARGCAVAALLGELAKETL